MRYGSPTQSHAGLPALLRRLVESRSVGRGFEGVLLAASRATGELANPAADSARQVWYETSLRPSIADA